MIPLPASIVRQGFLLGLAVLIALAGFGPRSVHAAPDDVLVSVQTHDGATVDGRLSALGPDGLTVQGSGAAKAVALDRLFRLEVREPDVPPPLGGSTLRAHLIGGERVRGHFAGPAEDGLVIETADAGKIRIRFDALESLAAIPAEAPPGYEPEARYPPTTVDDVAYRRSGDATSGLLLRVEDAGLVLEGTRGRERRVPWDDLAVLHLENDPLPPGTEALFEVETASGDRLLSTKAPRLDGEQIVLDLRSDGDTRIELPLRRVRRIGTFGGAFVFASDLPFTSAFETPYTGADDDPTGALLESWYGARVDRRPAGFPLTLHGTTYEHGFAVHARSRVALDLAGRFVSFKALVGVDDLALAEKGGGIVDARVRADGKVLWEAKGLQAGQAPRKVGPLDVTGVDALVLEIDFGPDGLHVRDYATWADPVLHRK